MVRRSRQTAGYLSVACCFFVADFPRSASQFPQSLSTSFQRITAVTLRFAETGIPTLVEVKRSTDTRLRREVVGQMLDYAANAVVYWPVERLEAEFETTARAAGNDPESC